MAATTRSHASAAARGGKKNAYATVGATMVSAGSMLSEDSAYGEALVKCGEAFVKVGSAQVELVRPHGLAAHPFSRVAHASLFGDSGRVSQEGVISERFLGTAQARLDGDMKEFTVRPLIRIRGSRHFLLPRSRVPRLAASAQEAREPPPRL